MRSMTHVSGSTCGSGWPGLHLHGLGTGLYLHGLGVSRPCAATICLAKCVPGAL